MYEEEEQAVEPEDLHEEIERFILSKRLPQMIETVIETHSEEFEPPVL